LYGRSIPKREFIEAFAEAFELTLQERGELAWVYTYGFRPDTKRLMIVERKRHSDVLFSALGKCWESPKERTPDRNQRWESVSEGSFT
jgi:hypothetical protein